MNNKNFIINSDDFGLDSFVNEACIILNQDKKINSISVILNYQNLETIKNDLKRFDGKIGLHLNLTESKPLNNIIKDEIIKQGCFQGYKKITKSFFLGKLNYKTLYMEAEKQLLSLNKISKGIDHIDGHQHIHMIPTVWKVVNDLAINYNIPRVRRPIERISLNDNLFIIFKKIVFYIFSFFNKQSNKIKYYKFFGHSLQNSSNYRELLEKKIFKKKNNYEIMVHVSKKDDIISNEKIKFGRQREYDIINKMNFKL